MFFTGVMVPHHIYINKGNLQFEDISATAGITKMNTNGPRVQQLRMLMVMDGWIFISVIRVGQIRKKGK